MIRLAQGVEAAARQRILGHSSITVTRYVDVIEQVRQDAVSKSCDLSDEHDAREASPARHSPRCSSAHLGIVTSHSRLVPSLSQRVPAASSPGSPRLAGSQRSPPGSRWRALR